MAKSKYEQNKPKITSVSYGRTVNVGNYESVRVDWTAEIQPGQDAAEVLEQLRDLGNREEKKIKAQRF